MGFKRIHLAPLLVALVMSYISSRYLFVGSGLSLIPWGLLALTFGLAAKSAPQAKKLGAIYGFSQSFIFLWIDKAGHLTIGQFFILLGIVSVLSLLAGTCAAVAALISFMLKQRFSH